MDVMELSSRYDADSNVLDTTKLSPAVFKSPIKTLNETSTIEPEDSFPTVSAVPLDIITNDARLWGLGNTSGGTASTGVSDLEWISTSVGANMVQIGGTSAPSTIDWSRGGLSAIGSQYGLDISSVRFGAREAFVFDAAILPADLTISTDPAEYGTLSSGEETELSSFDIDYVPLGYKFTVNGSSLTVDGTTVTAVPEDPETDYAYVFDGWYNGSAKITSSTVVTGDMQITAKFLKSPIITITFNGNGGTPSIESKEVVSGQPYGELPTAELDGKYFKGWYTANGLKITSESTVSFTEDATLYAQWSIGTYDTLMTMIDLLPMLCVIGIIFGLIGAALYFRTKD